MWILARNPSLRDSHLVALSQSFRRNEITISFPGDESRLAFNVFNDATSKGLVISRRAIPLNTWVHVAIVHDGARASMFWDGLLQASAEMPAATDVLRSMNFIGKGLSSYHSNFDGKVSTFFFFWLKFSQV